MHDPGRAEDNEVEDKRKENISIKHVVRCTVACYAGCRSYYFDIYLNFTWMSVFLVKS